MKSMVLGRMVDPAVRAPGVLLRRAVAAVVVAAVLSGLVLAYGKGCSSTASRSRPSSTTPVARSRPAPT